MNSPFTTHSLMHIKLDTHHHLTHPLGFNYQQARPCLLTARDCSRITAAIVYQLVCLGINSPTAHCSLTCVDSWFQHWKASSSLSWHMHHHQQPVQPTMAVPGNWLLSWWPTTTKLMTIICDIEHFCMASHLALLLGLDLPVVQKLFSISDWIQSSAGWLLLAGNP